MAYLTDLNPLYVAIGIGGYVIYAILLWWATWIFYVFTMGTVWSGHQISGTTKKLVEWNLMLAFGLNVLLNYTVMSVLFLELPKWGEPNVSARLRRLRRWSGLNWRQRLADKLATVWLDAFDPTGFHV